MRFSEVRAIAMGASAGGVEALNQIFSHLQKPLPVPVVVTLHIAPVGSILVEAFARAVPGMKVKEAEDKEFLEPGWVYFAPPNYHLLVETDHSLSLSIEEPVHFARPSIDVMFESAAEAFGSGLLGILLTGANEDGSSGLQRIHLEGGFTVVQDPVAAHSDIMPRAALDKFRPSLVGGLHDIGELLSSIAAQVSERRVAEAKP